MTAGLKAVETALPSAMGVSVIATVLLLAAIVVHRMIRWSPAGRHAVLLVALLTVGLCPVMLIATRLVPTAGFIPRRIQSHPIVLPVFQLPHHSVPSVAPNRPPLSEAAGIFSPSRHVLLAGILLVLWAAGVSVSLARLIRGLHVMSRVRRSWRPVPDARITALQSHIALALGHNAPEIGISEQVGVPVALGWLRPVVLLPPSFLTRFNDHQLFQILVHECAHALRRDTLVGLYQRLLAAVLWFHPLIYVANWMLDRAREELCDNYVLQAVAPTEYSRTLLAVAQSLSPVPNGWFAPALIQMTRHLEDRVAGLINPRRCIMTRLTSKTTAIIALGFIGAAFVLSCFAATPTDEEAIRGTITNYIEGYYTGDASRMERSLHPHYLKHTISGSNGKLKMTEWTGLQMVQDVRSHAPSPMSERKKEITVLDIAGDVASAKLVTNHWVDYMTLSKWNGEWKIVSVVLRETE